MHSDFFRKILTAAGVFFAGWLGLKFLMPVLLPFLMGALIALAAEPAVRLWAGGGKRSRTLAAGLGVTMTLVLLVGVLSFVGALAVKELGMLAGAMPDMQKTVRQGLGLLEDAMVGIADRLPDGIRTLAAGTVLEVFDGGNTLLEQGSRYLSGMVTAVLGWIPDGALGLGTGVIAAFMISARLPQLRQILQERMPPAWYSRYLPALRRVRRSLGGWLKAQGKLAAVTFGITALGLTVLGVPYGFLWAVPVALVDAVPMLGTGVILVPWALVAFLQGQSARGVGLLAVCAVAMGARRILEPKMVGEHLDLDPLVTLVFLYAGYRFWGVIGMILAPLLAAAAKSLVQPGE